MQQSNIRCSKQGKGTMIFKPEEMIGVIDLTSLGYYKIKTRDTTKLKQVL